MTKQEESWESSKKCTNCHVVKPLTEFYRSRKTGDFRASYCKICQRKYEAKRYYSTPSRLIRRGKTNSRLTYLNMRAKYPEKIKARMIMGNAITQGKLIRLPCVECGNPKSQGHHKDYSKPLEVIWLCSKHHGLTHRKYDFKQLVASTRSYSKKKYATK